MTEARNANFDEAGRAVNTAILAVSMARGKKPEFQPRWRSDIIAVVVGLILTALLVTLMTSFEPM